MIGDEMKPRMANNSLTMHVPNQNYKYKSLIAPYLLTWIYIYIYISEIVHLACGGVKGTIKRSKWEGNMANFVKEGVRGKEE